MNAIVTAFAEQGLVLGAILLLAIYLQVKIHKEGVALRKEMSNMKDDLRKDIGDLGQRVARLEGPPPRGAPYDAVAERPPEDERGPE